VEYRPTSGIAHTFEAGELSVQVCRLFVALPPLKEGHVPVAEYLEKVERSPRRAAALQRARKRAGLVSDGGQPTLAQLRLAAGLSQSQLADRLGTKQPNIARWERDPQAMSVETVIRYARALGVGPDLVFRASSLANAA